MNLKPQDVCILLKLAARGGREWSYSSLADELYMSPSEVHAGVKRAEQAGLMNLQSKELAKSALEEFLAHGIRYAFPPERGGQTRGIPTGFAAPPLKSMIAGSDADPPVWPDPEGTVRGYEFSPLYPSVVKAVKKDSLFYELLALVDAIRDGRARESKMAVRELKKRITSHGKNKRRKSRPN